MSGDRLANALFLSLALLLPLSALIARGLPRERTLRLAGLWAVIFVAAALLAGLTRH